MSHFIVGLTGPMGAGKSSVSALLREMGLQCIDADQVSRQVAAPDSPCLKDLVKAFGSQILQNEALDRKKLAAIAFQTEESRNLLEQITHPYITREIVRLIDLLPDGDIVVVEATMLFGSPLEPLCHTTVAVIANDTVRLERILHRDSMDSNAALMRMRSQPSCEEYQRRAAHTIVNNDGQNELMRQTAQLCAQLKEACL